MQSNFLEFIPLLLFFGAYQYYGNLLHATMVLLASTLMILAISIIRKKKITQVNLIATIILITCSVIVVITKNPTLIKIKPTLVYIFFAAALWLKMLKNKFLLKSMIGHVLQLHDAVWRKLTKQWISFFIIAALINEIVRHYATNDSWVKFKVFVMPIVTMSFTLVQIYKTQKHQKDIE